MQAVEKMEMNPNTIMPLVDLVFTFSKMAVVLIEHNLIREKPNLDFLVSLKGTQSTKRQSVALSAINTHHKLNKISERVHFISTKNNIKGHHNIEPEPNNHNTTVNTRKNAWLSVITSRSIGQTFQTCISEVQHEQPHEF